MYYILPPAPPPSLHSHSQFHSHLPSSSKPPTPFVPSARKLLGVLGSLMEIRERREEKEEGFIVFISSIDPVFCFRNKALSCRVMACCISLNSGAPLGCLRRAPRSQPQRPTLLGEFPEAALRRDGYSLGGLLVLGGWSDAVGDNDGRLISLPIPHRHPIPPVPPRIPDRIHQTHKALPPASPTPQPPPAMARRALLILDLQKEFLDPSVGRCLLPKLPPSFLPQLELLLPKFRDRQSDVFWFRSESKGQRDFTDWSVEERIIVCENSEDEYTTDDEYYEEEARREKEVEEKERKEKERKEKEKGERERRMEKPPIRPLPPRMEEEDLDAEDEDEEEEEEEEEEEKKVVIPPVVARRSLEMPMRGPGPSIKPPPIRPLPSKQPETLAAEEIEAEAPEKIEKLPVVAPAPKETPKRPNPPPQIARPAQQQKVAGARRKQQRRQNRPCPTGTVVRRGVVGPAARPPLLTDAYLSIDSPHPPVLPNTPASEWYEPIVPLIQKSHVVMKKSWYSAFKDTDLLFQLRSRLISKIYVCGVMSNVGVLATVADAVRHGIDCTVVEDCCGYRNGEANARAIDMMVGEFEVDLVKMEDVQEMGTFMPSFPGFPGLPAFPKLGAAAMPTDVLLKTLSEIGTKKGYSPSDDEEEVEKEMVEEPQTAEAVNGVGSADDFNLEPVVTSSTAQRGAKSASSQSQSPPNRPSRPPSIDKSTPLSGPVSRPKTAESSKSLEEALRTLEIESDSELQELMAENVFEDRDSTPMEADDGEADYVFPSAVPLPRTTRRMEIPTPRVRGIPPPMTKQLRAPRRIIQEGMRQTQVLDEEKLRMGDTGTILLPAGDCLGPDTREVNVKVGRSPAAPRRESPNEAAQLVSGENLLESATSGEESEKQEKVVQKAPSSVQSGPPRIPTRRTSIPEKRVPPPVPDKPKPEVIRRMSHRKSSASMATPANSHHPPPVRKSSTAALTTPPTSAPTTTTPPSSSPSSPIATSGKPKKKLPKGFQSSAPILTKGDPIGTGDSSLHHPLLPPPLATTAFSSLLAEVQWRTMYHRGGEVPRLVAVQGAINPVDGSFPIYRHPADESPPLMAFTETVEQIRKYAEGVVGHPLNHVLVQCYRGGNDYISEHADKTLDIARGSSIVNVSLGAQRTMILRRKKDSTVVPSTTSTSDETPTPSEIPQQRELQRVPLPHNSLFILGWNTNTHFQHSIKPDKREAFLKTPEELAENGARISLTFRNIATFLSADEARIWGQGAVCKEAPSFPSPSSSLGGIGGNSGNGGLAPLAGRPIVLGPCPESERLLASFGKENQSARFDWEAEYAPGFDILHFVPPVPKLRRILPPSTASSPPSSSGAGSGSGAGERGQTAAIAESFFEAKKMEAILRLKGVRFEVEDVVLPAYSPSSPSSTSSTTSTSPHPDIPRETLPAFVDTDRERSTIHSAVALVSYLERWYTDITGRRLLPQGRAEFAEVVERVVEEQVGGRGRGGGSGIIGESQRRRERELEMRWPVLRALKGLEVREGGGGGVEKG
ncbi:hypothetical protein EX30DRAFT_367153 [Ascodesmis nigricans]|uniref:Fe2OG dioxygenase domain-containing protein n=1 Tax=Ascodesmis nigricans TaxID=341454 RepID=A0A4S2MNJ1_9PEZI|nr:hypothetical protein EX30DRAFT_367153 [Ascodesmis nigricans]